MCDRGDQSDQSRFVRLPADADTSTEGRLRGDPPIRRPTRGLHPNPNPDDEAGSLQLAEGPVDVIDARVPAQEIADLRPAEPVFAGVAKRDEEHL
jgi:hypothetical protein